MSSNNLISNSNQPKLTESQWKEFQEFKDEYLKSERIKKFQLQQILDILEGRIRSANVVEYRNTYSEYDWGNCDTTYDFIMDFTLIEEMTKLVKCEVSFRIRPFSSGVTIT